MNFTLSQVPNRSQKPREKGITMVMDKGLSVRETEDMISTAGPFIDIVKLGHLVCEPKPG
jgi:phosphosulfolactate synthase